MRDRSGFHPIGYIETAPQDTIFLSTTDECKIKHIIDPVTIDAAPGSDDIKPNPNKYVAFMLANPLTQVCSCILQSGLFPEELKIERVTIIHKGRPKDELKNYRPISLLSILPES